MSLRLRTVLVVLGALLLAPALAVGHANLVGTTPSNDQVVPTSPKQIVLTFDEAVERSLGSVQLFDGSAKPVPLGALGGTRSGEMTAPIPSTLATGTYTVVWRVVSADGHPINGYFVFHVKQKGANPEGVVGRVGTGTPSEIAQGLDAVTRFATIALTILIIGGIALVTLIITGLAPALETRMWYIVAALAFILSLAAAFSLVIQGAAANGVPLAEAMNGNVIRDVLISRFGKMRVLLAVIAEVIGVLAIWGAASHRSRGVVRATQIATVALAFPLGMAGHPSVDGLPTMFLDGVHVLSAGLWVGGLAFLALALAMAGSARATLAAQGVPRYSQIALVAVGTLILSGALNGLVELGWSPGRLFSTAYGRLIVVKIILALVLIGFGAFNRRLVARLRQRMGDRPVARFRRVILAELAVMAGVLGVTTQLVAEPPARAVARATAGAPQTAATRVGAFDADVRVEPGGAGPNTVTVLLTKGGRSVDPDEVRVSAANTAAGLGPISAPTVRTRPGTYEARSMPLTASGEWTIDVSVRQGDFDQFDGSVTVTLR